MENANVLTGFIFGLLGILKAFSGSWISASLFLALGAAFLLMDATSARHLVVRTSLLPVWRRFTVLALLGVSMGLFGFQVGHELKAKAKASPVQQNSQRR